MHAAAGAAGCCRLKCAWGLDGFGEWPRVLLSEGRHILTCLRCDRKCFRQRQALLHLYQALYAWLAPKDPGLGHLQGS